MRRLCALSAAPLEVGSTLAALVEFEHHHLLPRAAREARIERGASDGPDPVGWTLDCGSQRVHRVLQSRRGDTSDRRVHVRELV